MSAEAAEMPVKPRMPATIDTRKKISAHLRIVIACSNDRQAATTATRPIFINLMVNPSNRFQNGGRHEAVSGAKSALLPFRPSGQAGVEWIVRRKVVPCRSRPHRH